MPPILITIFLILLYGALLLLFAKLIVWFLSTFFNITVPGELIKTIIGIFIIIEIIYVLSGRSLMFWR